MIILRTPHKKKPRLKTSCLFTDESLEKYFDVVQNTYIVDLEAKIDLLITRIENPDYTIEELLEASNTA